MKTFCFWSQKYAILGLKWSFLPLIPSMFYWRSLSSPSKLVRQSIH